MRIVTWNINSIRLRIDLLKKLCLQHNPDVICLQETKTEDKYFPIEAINDLGFKYVVYSGQKSYNGVAILSKFKITQNFALNLYNDDKRHICAYINNFEIHNFYVPAGGDEPDTAINPKYKHKLAYVQLMQDWFSKNRQKEKHVILVGDLNIAPHEHDVWSSHQLRNVISHTPLERKALLSLQASFDFVDTSRHFTNFEQKLYTWWSYRNKDWKKSNRGRRLDHIWVSQSLKALLKQNTYQLEARDWTRPSDHIPYIIDIA